MLNFSVTTALGSLPRNRWGEELTFTALPGAGGPMRTSHIALPKLRSQVRTIQVSLKSCTCIKILLTNPQFEYGRKVCWAKESDDKMFIK